MRPWAAVLWIGLCLASLGWLFTRARLPSGAAGEDCAAATAEALRALRPRVPPRAVIAFVGVATTGGCNPRMIAGRVLAPALVLVDDPDGIAWIRASGPVVPVAPALVLAWGAEGERWIAGHPDARLVASEGPARLLARPTP
jgi:hypothetical protein